MEKFLNAYHDVADLSPESLPTDEKHEYWGISRRDFFKELHVDVGIENRIKEEILTTREQIIFLVGPRGSGKTTNGLKTVVELERMNYLTHWIIVSKEEAKKYLDDRRELLKFLRKRIANFLLNEINHFGNDGANASLNRLTAYLLCEDLLETQRPSSFNPDFVHEQMELQLLLGINGMEYEQILGNLSENLLNAPAIEALRKQLLGKVELEHLCHAVKFFSRVEDIVVWIDNIDVFEQQDQLEMINALISINNSAPEHLRFVVAAREENVLRFEHFWNVQGDVRKATVYMNDNKNGEHHYGMYVPYLGEKFLEIVKLRLDFSREFQKRIEHKVRVLSNSTSEANKMKASALEERFLPVIAEIRRKYVELLSEKVLKAFIGEKIPHLFNNNLRALLPLHSDLMSHLIGIGHDRNNNLKALAYDDSFMKTQLLYWLCTVNGEGANEFRYFNIVRHSRNLLLNSTGSQPEIACFLPFMTLSCVWNLCLRNKINSGDTFAIPTIQEVIDKLSKLQCFDEKEIKSTIIELYNPAAGGYTMFLAIESRERLSHINQLNNDHRIRITYKGRAALASLCNSFGFVYAMQSITDNRTQSQVVLDENKLNHYFVQLLPDLKQIGRLHLNSLIQIRKRPAYAGRDNWLDIYLNDFGIPLEGDYSRTMRACKGYGTSPKKVLYFDSLLHSIESYAKEGRARQLKEAIKNLIDDFSRTLNKIENSEIIEIDDFDFGRS